MNSIADSSVIIQTSPQSVPSLPSWFGEVAMIAAYLRKLGILTKIAERVRFARKRFGCYEVIDFVAVLFGYAISGEHTLQAFYERLAPFATAYMALFGRKNLPARSTLSRFLAALTKEPVEALRSLFLDDLVARPLSEDRQTGGVVDRCRGRWLVFDIDGTREAARQRSLPKSPDLPEAKRRLQKVAAPGYTGRKRGEVVRTRTVVSQAHSCQWLGTFGNRGNGQYRQELQEAVQAIRSYLTAHQLPHSHALLRLDGQYGNGAVVASLADFAFVMRGKDYTVLDHPLVQARLHLPPDQQQQRPESEITRTLYDCPEVPLGPEGSVCRVVVATHPAGKTKSRVGVTREGLVYELFFTKLPQQAFTARDVVELYLHCGAFEPQLSDEDAELDPDRWCSHSPCGQECWQIVSQWIWNLRLELGHQLLSSPMRITEFAPAVDQSQPPGYNPAVVGGARKAGRFAGEAFALQPDGTVRCPADKRLLPCERRKEPGGSLRIVFAARIADCRACQLREQCQRHGKETRKPRQMSVLLHPFKVGPEPLLWCDWPRRSHRRACRELLRRERVEVTLPQASPPLPAGPLPRSQRAHYRLSWESRLARNARTPTDVPPTITLFGIPDQFATFLGLKAA